MNNRNYSDAFHYMFLDLEIKIFFDEEIDEWYLSICQTSSNDQVMSQYLDTNNLEIAKKKALFYIKRECNKRVEVLKDEIREFKRHITRREIYIDKSDFEIKDVEEQLNNW